jgi:SAM-dependent methyltransferase
MEKLINIIRIIRAVVNRKIMPRSRYLAKHRIQPVSTKYGFDRGKAADRFYIEKFMETHQEYVKGVCGEIEGNHYILKYGANKVTRGEIIDNDAANKKTTILGDLRNLTNVKSNIFDCLIVTQTLNVVNDYEAAIRECYRILKPGGVLLVTMPTISPAWNIPINLWRFTAESSEYVFGKYFGKDNVQVTSYGNKLVAESFWIGFAIEDLTKAEFEKSEKNWSVIIGIVAKKII